MVVIVSTQPRRLVGVLVGGAAIVVALLAVARRFAGLVSLIAAVAAIAVASLIVAYVLAVVVEGLIDRNRRNALGERLGPSRDGDGVVDRCSHCLRPQVIAGGVSICPNCDQ